MSDWTENLLYLLAGGTLGLFVGALAAAAGRAEAAFQPFTDVEGAGRYANPDEDDIDWDPRVRRAS